MRLTFATEAAGTDRPDQDFIAATPRAIVLLDAVRVAGTESGCIHGMPWFVGQLAGIHTAEASIDLTDALARAVRHCPTGTPARATYNIPAPRAAPSSCCANATSSSTSSWPGAG